MGSFLTIDEQHLSPAGAVNATVGEWGVEPLPANLTFINGTLHNGTLVDGKIYNGTAINGTTIIERLQATTIGNISTASFIYMIMSLLIIIIMLTSSIRWGSLVASQRHPYAPTLRASAFPRRAFEKRLERYYPVSGIQPLPSYAETLARPPGGKISPQDLRELRELIRSKYVLDVRIWNLRDVHITNQHIVDDCKRRSAGALADIIKIVNGWMSAGDEWKMEEYLMVMQIHQRLRPLMAKQPEFFTGPSGMTIAIDVLEEAPTGKGTAQGSTTGGYFSKLLRFIFPSRVSSDSVQMEQI